MPRPSTGDGRGPASSKAVASSRKPRSASGATRGAACAATPARSSGFVHRRRLPRVLGDPRARDRTLRPARGRGPAHRCLRVSVQGAPGGARPAVARRALADRLGRALLARHRPRLGHGRPLDSGLPLGGIAGYFGGEDGLRDHAVHGRDALDPEPPARDRDRGRPLARASSRS